MTLLQSLKESAILKKEEEKPKGNGSTVAAILAILVLLASMGILLWRSYRKSKEFARLLHEADVLQAQREAAVYNAKLKQFTERGRVLDAVVVRIDAELEIVETKLNEAFTAKLEIQEQIRSALSWDDLDRIPR